MENKTQDISLLEPPTTNIHLTVTIRRGIPNSIDLRNYGQFNLRIKRDFKKDLKAFGNSLDNMKKEYTTKLQELFESRTLFVNHITEGSHNLEIFDRKEKIPNNLLVISNFHFKLPISWLSKDAIVESIDIPLQDRKVNLKNSEETTKFLEYATTKNYDLLIEDSHLKRLEANQDSKVPPTNDTYEEPSNEEKLLALPLPKLERMVKALNPFPYEDESKDSDMKKLAPDDYNFLLKVYSKERDCAIYQLKMKEANLKQSQTFDEKFYKKVQIGENVKKRWLIEKLPLSLR